MRRAAHKFDPGATIGCRTILCREENNRQGGTMCGPDAGAAKSGQLLHRSCFGGVNSGVRNAHR